MSNLIIRRAVIDDLAVISELEKVSFSDSWSEESLKHDIVENDNALYMVAESDGKVLAYANMWCVLDEGQLVRIAVFPEARRMHLGERLLKETMKITEEKGAIFWTLDVRVDNEPAIRMYKKIGFLEDGIRKKYYSEDNCDALLMHCEKDWI